MEKEIDWDWRYRASFGIQEGSPSAAALDFSLPLCLPCLSRSVGLGGERAMRVGERLSLLQQLLLTVMSDGCVSCTLIPQEKSEPVPTLSNSGRSLLSAPVGKLSDGHRSPVLHA